MIREHANLHVGLLTVAKDGKFSRKQVRTVEPVTYSEFYRLFAKAIAGEGEVPVKAEEAAAVIRLVELAKESSRTGKTLEL